MSETAYQRVKHASWWVHKDADETHNTDWWWMVRVPVGEAPPAGAIPAKEYFAMPRRKS